MEILKLFLVIMLMGQTPVSAPIPILHVRELRVRVWRHAGLVEIISKNKHWDIKQGTYMPEFITGKFAGPEGIVTQGLMRDLARIHLPPPSLVTVTRRKITARLPVDEARVWADEAVRAIQRRDLVVSVEWEECGWVPQRCLTSQAAYALEAI